MSITRGWLRLVVPVAIGVAFGSMVVSAVGELGHGIALIKAVLWPLAMALLLAYIFDPLVSWLHRRWGWSRLLGTAVLFVVGYATLVTLLIWLVPKAVFQVYELAQSLPAMVQHGREWLGRHPGINQWLDSQMPPGASTQPDFVTKALAYVQGSSPSLLSFAEQGVAVAGAGLAWAFYVLSLVVLMPLYTFVFLWRFDRVKVRADSWLPEHHRQRVRAIAHKMDAVVAAFFRGRVIVCVIDGALTAAAWTVVGLPLGLLLGLLTGVLGLVPFMPLFIALPISVLVAIFMPEHAEFSLVLMTVVTFTVIQLLDGFVLTPAIQGRAAGLHPITVLVVLLIGSAWMGVLGLLLAIPVAAAIKVFVVEWASPQFRQWLHAGLPPEMIEGKAQGKHGQEEE